MMIDPWHIFTADYGTVAKPFTGFVTLLDMLIYMIFMVNVSRARTEYNVKAPHTEGPEPFLRVLRVQQNTVEQLIFHLPILWIAAFAMDDVFAASLGAIWCFSRGVYARGYYQKAKRRAKGFIIGMLVNVVLLVGAMLGVLASF